MVRPFRGSNNGGTIMPMGYRVAPPMRLTRPSPGIFCKSYQCHSMACLDRPGLEFGDKIIMPQAAFREAHRLRLKLPLLFKLVNATEKTRRITGTSSTAPCHFCGVLEFSAPDDQVFLPFWLMQNLLLSEGARVELRSLLQPPAGSFVRFKPHNDSFLGVAARQGPKVLMEETLRRYSVLCEGATILVQHEGENFYLDVVEVRTFASIPTTLTSDGGNNDDDNFSSAVPVETPYPAGVIKRGDSETHGQNETRDTSNVATVDGADDGDDKSPLPPSVGRRVKLVSLLGDLDLEVEFSAPHSAAAPSASPPQHDTTEQQHEHGDHHQDSHLLTKGVVEHEQMDDDGGHGRASSRVDPRFGARNSTVVSSSAGTLAPPLPSSAVFDRSPSYRFASKNSAAGSDRSLSELTARSNGGRSSSELAVPLPAPARARKSDEDCPSAVVGPGSESARWRPGYLGIKPPAPPTWRASSKASKCQAFSGKGMSLLGRTSVPDLTNGGGALMEHEFAVVESVFQSQQGVSGGTAPTTPPAAPATPAATLVQRNETPPESLAACDGVSQTPDSPAGTGRCVGSKNGEKEPTTGEGGSSSGGKCSPTAVDGTYPADSAAGSETRSMAVVHCGSCGKLVPAANQLLHELRCSSSTGTRRGRDSALPFKPSVGVHQKKQSPLSISRGSYPARADRPSPAARAISSVGTVDTAVAAQERSTTTTTKIISSPMSALCAYCGLSFRTASAADEHEIACAARTERCDRCCGLVSRREADSHRRPGGGCDTAITTAQAAEAVVAAGVGERGRRARAGGGEVIGGRFDALLAEAVRSSKAASAVLADAREKNDAWMAKAACEGRGDQSICSHFGGVCNGGGGKDCHGRFGGRVGDNGSRDYSERHTEELLLSTPECRADNAEIRARENRSSQANGVDKGPGIHDRGATFDASRIGSSTSEGGQSLFSRLLEGTVSCVGSTSSKRLDPRSEASASAAATENCDISTTTPADSGKGSFLDRCHSPCRSTLEKEEESGKAEGKSSTHYLEVRPWTCTRCTLMNLHGSGVCDACGSTPQSAATDLEGAVDNAKWGDAKNPDIYCPSHSAAATPAPDVTTSTDGERSVVSLGTVDSAVITVAGRAESDMDGVMPVELVAPVMAGVARTSARSLQQPSTKFIPAVLRVQSAVAVTADEGEPPPRSSGTLSSTLTAIGRNTGLRAGALPALVTAATGYSPPDRQRSTSDRSTLSDAGGSAAGSRRVDRQELRRPSPRRRTPTSGATSVARRKQRRQQNNIPTVNLANRETDQHQRENRRRRRGERLTPPTTTISAGPPRRLGGVRRSRQLRYPASSLLTPPGEPPSSAQSASAAVNSTAFGPPSLSSSPPAVLIASTRTFQEPVTSHYRPPVPQQDDGLRLFSSSAPSAHPSVQHGGFKHGSDASGSKRSLKNGDGGSGSGGRDSRESSGGSSTIPGVILPESATPPSAAAAPVCDISLSILGKSQVPGRRVGRVKERDGTREGSGPGCPRHGTNLVTPQRSRQGLGRDVGGEGERGAGDARAWGRRGGADRTVGSEVEATSLRLRRRASGTRLLEPLIMT